MNVTELERKVADLEAQLAANKKVGASACCYVSKKTGKVNHGVRVTGDFYPVWLNVQRARDISTIPNELAAAADDCEARWAELEEEAVAKFKSKK